MNIKLKNTNDYLRKLQLLKKRCDSEFDYMHEQISKYKDEAHSIMVNIDKISSKLFWNTLAVKRYKTANMALYLDVNRPVWYQTLTDLILCFELADEVFINANQAVHVKQINKELGIRKE